MKVKELIEQLKKFDGNLNVCLCIYEDTSMLKQIRIETVDNHCYDQGDHVLEYMDFDECLMLSDDEYSIDNNCYLLEDDEEEYDD